MIDRDIIIQQRAFLDELQKISKKPITIKALEGIIPEKCKQPALYQWLFYKDIWPQIQKPIWTRRILDNEIVFDPDVKDWQLLREEMNKLLAFCHKSSIPSYLAYTGGNGVHLSIYMQAVEIDSKILQEAYEKDLDIAKIIRQTAVNYLLESSGADAKKIALDSKKYNFSKMRSGSQLREYGTPREGGGFKTLIDNIPALKPNGSELPLRFPDAIVLWDISLIAEKIDANIQKELDRAARNNETNLDPITFTDCKINSFPCIKELIEKGRSSARYYGGQSIALMMKKCGYTWESTEPIVQKYFKKCTGLTKSDIEKRLSDVKNTATEYDYRFSCREFKEIFGKEYCKFQKCPISAKLDKARADKEKTNKETKNEPNKEADIIILKATEIMEKGDPVKYILDTHQKMHVGDDNLAMTLLLSIGCQSVKNSEGIHPKVSGESGKGKTHCCKAMMRLIPRQWRLETTLSDKAIYYAEIEPSTVVFSDDVNLSESLEGVIKRASSNFQEGDRYMTIDSQRNPLSLFLPPRITWWLTSVDDNQSLQLLNRQFGGGVDESPEQDKKVMKFQIQQAIKGEESFPETEETKICQEIIAMIKKQLFKVAIPFFNCVKWNDPENRRNLPIFFDIIRSLAVLRFKQRSIKNDVLLATLQDFYDAKDLYCSKAENQKLKLNDMERRTCECLRDIGECDTTTLCRNLNISFVRLSQIMNGKDGKTGLLEKVKGMSVETISVKDEERTTHKKMYSLSGFNGFDAYASVVSIDLDELRRLNDLTGTLPQLNPHINYNINNSIISTDSEKVKKSTPYLPNSQKNDRKENFSSSSQSKKDYQDKVTSKREYHNDDDSTKINFLLSPNPKTGKYGKVGEADSDIPEVKLGLSEVKSVKALKVFNLSHLCTTGQHKECGGFECSCICHTKQ